MSREQEEIRLINGCCKMCGEYKDDELDENGLCASCASWRIDFLTAQVEDIDNGGSTAWTDEHLAAVMRGITSIGLEYKDGDLFRVMLYFSWGTKVILETELEKGGK